MKLCQDFFILRKSKEKLRLNNLIGFVVLPDLGFEFALLWLIGVSCGFGVAIARSVANVALNSSGPGAAQQRPSTRSAHFVLLRFCLCGTGAAQSAAQKAKANKRAHPDLNQGPADLQSAALTTELCTHCGYFPLCRPGIRNRKARNSAVLFFVWLVFWHCASAIFYGVAKFSARVCKWFAVSTSM